MSEVKSTPMKLTFSLTSKEIHHIYWALQYRLGELGQQYRNALETHVCRHDDLVVGGIDYDQRANVLEGIHSEFTAVSKTLDHFKP